MDGHLVAKAKKKKKKLVTEKKKGGASTRTPVKSPNAAATRARKSSSASFQLKKRKGRKKGRPRISKNKETILTLVDSLNTKTKFGPMITYTLECLRKLAEPPAPIPDCEEIIELKALPGMAKVMDVHPNNEEIMDQVNMATLALCRKPKLCDKVGDDLGGRGLTYSLANHESDKTLGLSAKTTLKLLKSGKHINSFVDSGMIKASASLLSRKKDNADIAGAAAAILDRLTDAGPEAVTAAWDTGVAKDLLDAVEKNPQDAQLVQGALGLIAKWAKDPKRMKALRKMGAVDILVAAVEMHPDNARILELAGMALALLSSAEDIAGALANLKDLGCNLKTAMAMSKIASLLLAEENIKHFLDNGGLDYLIKAIKIAMKEDPPTDISRRIIASGCRALGRIATTDKRIHLLMEKKVVKLLVKVMKTHPDNENVSCSAMAALSQMLTREVNCKFIADSKGNEAVLGVLEAQPDSSRVANNVLNYFARMGVHKPTFKALVSLGALEKVVGIARKFTSEVAVAGGVYTCLENLSGSAYSNDKIGAAGGLDAINEIMTTHMEDPDMLFDGLLLIEKMGNTPHNQALLQRNGAEKVVKEIMKEHEENEDMMELCERVMFIISGKDMMTVACEKAIEDAQAIAAKPGSTPWTNIHAALTQIIAYCDDPNNKAKLQEANAYGVCQEAVVACSASGKDQDALAAMSLAIDALRKLQTLFPDTYANMIKDGTLAKMFETATTSKNLKLAEKVSDFAAEVAGSDKELAQLMAANGFIEAAIALAESQPEQEVVLANTTKLLGLLCDTDDTVQASLDAGGAEILVETLYANMENPPVLANALVVVAQHCTDADAINNLLEAGCVDAVIAIMKKYPKDVLVMSGCIQALSRMAVEGEVAEEIGEKGGLKPLVKAMRAHYKDENLVEMDMVLLETLAQVEDNLTKLGNKKLAAADLIQYIMDSYPGNDEIQESGKKLHRALTGPTDAELRAERERKARLLISDEPITLTGAMCDIILNNMEPGALDREELLTMLTNLLVVLQNPKNARLMYKRGGQEKLAALMQEWKHDAEIHDLARQCYMRLLQNGMGKDVSRMQNPAAVGMLCDLINGNQLSVDELTTAISLLANMKLDEAMIDALLNKNPFLALLKIVCEGTDAKLISQAARLLAKLSNDDRCCNMMQTLADVGAIIKAMRTHKKLPKFVQFCAYLLGNLAGDDSVKEEIGTEGGMMVLIKAVKRHMANESVVDNCTYALSACALDSPGNCNYITAANGITSLLNVLTTHPAAADCLEQACETLCNLCRASTESKEAIIEAGGTEKVVDVLLGHLENAELMETVFRTVGNLSHDEEAIIAVVHAGATQGIVAGLTTFADNDDMVDLGLRVLTQLCSVVDPEHCKTLDDEGAVAAVLDVIRTQTENVEVEATALGCLLNLARSNVCGDSILNNDGISVMANVLEEIGFEEDIVVRALAVLMLLACQPNKFESLMAADILTATALAVRTHIECPAVIQNGLGCIAALCSGGPERATQVGSKVSLSLVMTLLRQRGGDSFTVQECFKCLTAMATSEECATSMALQAMEHLRDALSAHLDDPDMSTTGFAFLANMCVHKAPSEAILDCPELVSQCLKTFSMNEHDTLLLVNGMRALENMCYHGPDIQELMKKEAVEVAVKEIMDQNQGDEAICNACRTLMAMINRQPEVNVEFKVIKMNKVGKEATTLGKDADRDIPPRPKLKKKFKNFLLAGTLLQKHQKDANPHSRHVYVSDDLRFFCWKAPTKSLNPKNKMKIVHIKSVEIGRATDVLKKKTFRGKFYAKEDCAFAIVGRKRTVDLEAKSEGERKKWENAINAVLKWRRECKLHDEQFELN